MNPKCVLIALVALVLSFTPVHAQTISKQDYRELVLGLFDEFLRMKKDGVFLDPQTVKQLTKAGYKFSNTTRGKHPPGGFFARPPGSDWLKRVQALRKTGHKIVCFDIPEMPSGTGICGFDLMALYSGVIGSKKVDFLDSVAARFHLATICHRNPAACTAAGTGSAGQDDCRPLFLAVSKTAAAMKRKGKEAQEIAMNGLDRGRRVSKRDYDLLADRLFQLLGWQGDVSAKLAKAVKCADGKG